jgi:capsular polysaccharide transport system permease protein
MRSYWAVTWAVWRALFLRDAVNRLFGRRAAWVWLLLEPIAHLVFFAFIFTVVRQREVGGIDTVTWLLFGLLGFFMFRRTFTMGLAAIGMALSLMAYRQVRPVDAVLVRCSSEGALMLALALLVWAGAAFLGFDVVPHNPLQVLAALGLLWLMGLGLSLILSVPREIIPEVNDLALLFLTPLYFISGVIFPLSVLSPSIREWLLWNPLVHVIAWLRQGFAPHYVPFPEPIQPGYALVWALALVFLGLVLQRVFERKVVQQ